MQLFNSKLDTKIEFIKNLIIKKSILNSVNILIFLLLV